MPRAGAALSVMALMSERFAGASVFCVLLLLFLFYFECLYVVFILSVYLMNNDVYIRL